jgi:hypothetical protein
MAGPSYVLLAVLLAADPSTAKTEGAAPAAAEDDATEAGVSPVQLIPRLELRQSFAKLEGGTSVHITTTEIDIGFVRRVLLRYEGQVRVVSSPTAGQVSGFGDAQVTALGLIASAPRYVAVAIVGGIFDTASQAPLGEGKQQLVLGGAAAVSPVRWWLPYLVVQEQVSVAGDSARPDINQLVGRLGNIVFGPGFTWYKLDLDWLLDFQRDAGQLLGRLEAGSLLIGRTGLFMRAGTQLAGTRQLDYSMEVGIRYLFRLEKGR